MSPLRLLIVDDHRMMRDGIRGSLALEPDFEVVAEAGSVAEARAAFREHRPDVTLMDIQLPDGTGTAAVAELRAEFPGARFIMLTTYEGDVDIRHALEAGAAGYLLKTVGGEELALAVRVVHRGGRYLSNEAAACLRECEDYRKLSQREVEVLEMLAKGLMNKEIAGLLGLSEFTIKSHLRRIFTKLGADDRVHALTIAVQRGIVRL